MKYFVIWMIIGAVVQGVAAFISGIIEDKIAEKHGLEFDDRYRLIYIVKGFKKLNPFAKSIDTYGNSLIRCIPLVIFGNLYGWLIWPVYVQVMYKSEKEALRSFLKDNGFEES